MRYSYLLEKENGTKCDHHTNEWCKWIYQVVYRYLW